MPKYNIIFTSPDDDPYLWNGTSLDQLEKTGQEVLKFSGRTFEHGELKAAIKYCRAFAKKMFPDDKDLKIKTVEIRVSD